MMRAAAEKAVADIIAFLENRISIMLDAIRKFRLDKNKIIDFLLILFLWIVIFDPPIIIGFNIIHIIGACSIIYILFNKKYWLPLLEFEIVIVALFAYIAIVSFLNGISFYDIIRSYVVYWIIDIVPISFVIVDICRIRKYDYDKFEQLIIGAGIVFAVISVSAILSSSLHDLYFNHLDNAGLIKHKSLSARTYGFASNLLYSSPIAVAIIGALCMKRFAVQDKIYYLFLSVAMMVVAYYNARISLFVYVGGCFAVFLAYKKHRKKLFITGVALVVFALIAFFVLFLIVRFSRAPGTHIVWLYNGLANIFGRFFGIDKNSRFYQDSFGYYFDPVRYQLPSAFINIIFGTGETIMMPNKFGVCTDIGFVNDVWYGGIVYVLCAYFALFVYCRTIIKKAPRHTTDKSIGRFWVIMLVLTFVVSNIKGIFIGFNNATSLMWLLLVFVVMRKRKLCENDFSFIRIKRVGSK